MTQELAIEYRDPKSLAPAAANARTHSRRQIDQIARSIRSFGFNNPVLLDACGQIIAGHGRVSAAIGMGLHTVPTVRLDHLSEAQRKAYIIADNRLAELAGWDEEILAIELQGLLDIDLDFEVTDTGFELPQIDLMMETARQSAEPADERIRFEGLPVSARRGDLWRLGEHLVFCGDALDPQSYHLLLAGERAEMVFTDPPYNVPIDGHVSGLGRAAHSEFLMASGEMSSEQFTDFLRQSMQCSADVSTDGAIHFICMDWRHLRELLGAGAQIYSELKNVCVWVKSNGGMGSLYRSQHEMVGVFKAGSARHINNVELGRHGRSRTNVWNYPGLNSFQKGRDAALAMHPTVKPTALVRDAIYDCSSRGTVILDPFGGSGTTLLAAEQAGRRARLIELDPRYVDVTLHRFFDATGIEPLNVWTGEVLRDVRDGRRPRKVSKRKGPDYGHR